VRRLLPLAAALALVPASAAAPVRSVTAPAPVLALAADGTRVAYASGFAAGDCNRVRLWDRRTGGVTRLGRGTNCVQTSTGTTITALALAGRRALWLHVTGGNIREWSLWTATGHLPAARRLRAVRAEADGPAPIVLGPGDASRTGDLLPYALGRAVTVLRVNGARRFGWTAPARVVALAANGGEVAVADAAGDVTVLDAAGAVLRRDRFGPAPIDVVRITGDSLVVQHGRTLEVRGGGRAAMYSLLAGARLADADGGRAVVVRRGRVSTFDLASGVGRDVSAGTFADLEGAALAVASGRTVSSR
jgi:hypothetical protein